MAKRNLIHPIVKVYWEDACGQQGWRPIKDARHEPVSTISVGYLVKKTQLGVTVAATLNDQTEVNDVVFIPRGMVQRIEVLRR